jgi:hypothetical protein
MNISIYPAILSLRQTHIGRLKDFCLKDFCVKRFLLHNSKRSSKICNRRHNDKGLIYSDRNRNMTEGTVTIRGNNFFIAGFYPA